MIRQLIANNIRKNDTIIAVGGGITQDIVAFVSSILYRGVKWKFYPTTLLAQCDSCIGSKSSINFDNYKNLLGTFIPPNEIYIYKGDDYKFISFNDTTVKFIEQSGGNRKRKMSKRKTLKIKTRKKSKSQSKSHSTPLLDEKIHHKKHKNSARNKH